MDRHAPAFRQHIMQSQQQSLPFQARFLAAAGASFVSALVVNPLDVVKTRMQAQAADSSLKQPLSVTPLLDKFAVVGCPSNCPRLSNSGSRSLRELCMDNCHIYGSTLDGMRKIVRQEGAGVLWRGTDVALLMAVPMVGIYLPLYDYLLTKMQHLGPYAPLAAGAAARTAAVLCTSPLELIRTRMQAVLKPETQPQALGHRASRTPMWAHLQLEKGSSMSARVRTLWTGVGATLARDVPFSALYWGLLEPIRGRLLRDPQQVPASEIAFANLTAGAIAGGAAAAITTPLDVVKTRAQLSGKESKPILRSLRELAAEGGVRSLFTGVGPRAARAAPACAIVVASYEVLKSVYVRADQKNPLSPDIG